MGSRKETAPDPDDEEKRRILTVTPPGLKIPCQQR